jgi:ATP-dependent RNA helicase DeaD
VFSSLPDALSRALQARGYTSPTPVQEAVLAPETEGRDLLVSAQTGSGKTVAYGLAMAPSLLEDGRLPQADAPLALIIAPTRELALQVQTELTWLYAEAGAEVACCVGGMDPFKERRALDRGAHIVVGTPGRLGDHLRRGALRLDNLHVVVLDEADEMLDLGFQEELEFLLQATPEERRTLLFSATLPKPIVALAKNYQDHALRIAIASDEGGHADIDYRAIRIAHAKVERTVVNLLRYLDPPSALVFCNTRLGVQKLGEALAARGFDVVALSGEMNQNERNRALTSLRGGHARVCVATDVAARGLDVPDLSLVIHADLPKDTEIMQHRSGRTGRAGKKGTSILLVPPSRRRTAEQMLLRAGVQYEWMDAPSRKAIFKQDRERLLDADIFTGTGSEDSSIASALLERHSPFEIAAALAKLYSERLPEPYDIEEYVEDPRQARDSERYDPRGRTKAGDRVRKEPRERREYDDREPRQERERKRRADRALPNGGVWFRISVGRERNADPKWLLPEICRQGEVTKKEIGDIRIFETETRFELDAAAAEAFTAKIAERSKGGIKIFPAEGGEPDYNHTPRPQDGEGEPRFKPKFKGKGDYDRKPRRDYDHKPKSDFDPRQTDYERKPKGEFERKPDHERKPKGEFARSGKGFEPKGKPKFGKKPFDKKTGGKKKSKHKKGALEV